MGERMSGQFPNIVSRWGKDNGADKPPSAQNVPTHAGLGGSRQRWRVIH